MVLLASLLSGCVIYPDITQSRLPCRIDPGGWCGFERKKDLRRAVSLAE